MSEIQGTVTAIKKDRKAIQIDNGDWYSSFNPLHSSVDRGKIVKFNHIKKGSWLNIKGFVEVIGEDTGAATTVAGSQGSSVPKNDDAPEFYTDKYKTLVKSFPVPKLHPDRSIIRQNALSHAVDIVTLSGIDVTPSANSDLAHEYALEVIEVARVFEAYATGDLEADEAEERLANMVAPMSVED